MGGLTVVEMIVIRAIAGAGGWSSPAIPIARRRRS
jgi:hypothetical protein